MNNWKKEKARKHDKAVLCFQKILFVHGLIVSHCVSLTRCVYVNITHAPGYSCIVLISRCQQREYSSGVRLIYCRHTRHIAIREIWPGKDRACKLYAWVCDVSACAHTSYACTCIFIYGQIKRAAQRATGNTRVVRRYTRVHGTRDKRDN